MLKLSDNSDGTVACFIEIGSIGFSYAAAILGFGQERPPGLCNDRWLTAMNFLDETMETGL